MNSPIKYYGGKSYMTDILKRYFPKDFSIYVEGFGGGASLLFSKKQGGVEVYNDLGENVYSLFKVLSDKEMFYRLKERMEITYYSAQLRDEFKELLKRDDLSIEDRAYYYLFVNRTSFNGVGGFSTNSYVRRNMSKSTSDYLSMIDTLPEIHNRLSSVIIEHRDIFDLIDKYDAEDTFMYLDPPYVWETRKSGTAYEVEMDNDAHQRFVDRLLQCKCKLLVSGYDHPIYDKLLTKFTKVSFPSPNSMSESTETLWMNYTPTEEESDTMSEVSLWQ
jgi:DNA adenine methylase